MATSREGLGLRGLLRDLRVAWHEARDEYIQSRRRQRYFRSLATTYPLLSESPRDLLEEEARRVEIPFKGRSKPDLARAVFEASHQKRQISERGR
jgi:hypothetical protein